MRHRMKGKKLGRDTSHRKALRKNLATDLVEQGSIVTTLAKAKYVRPYVETLVTRAKKAGTDKKVTTQYLRSRLTTENSITKLLDELAPRYKERPGGYTRIVRVGNRDGDNSSLARISFVEEK
jgi:large subunit ribosomal protein L17